MARGHNYSGQCTVPADAQSGVSRVSAGRLHSLALKDGRVIQWGGYQWPWWGQCDVPADAQNGVTQIAAGYDHSLALKRGRVIAWGENYNGQCNVPEAAKSGVIQIAAGHAHSLALKVDGRVIAWGCNSSGQCDIPDKAVPNNLTKVIRLSAGGDHSLALRDDGRVIAWGENWHGQCNVPDDAGSGVTEVAAGEQHSLALKDGKVIAWGWNSSLQCKVPADAKIGVTQISGGAEYSLALKEGRVIGWGDNNWNQGYFPDVQSGVSYIAAGWGHTLLVKDGAPLLLITTKTALSTRDEIAVYADTLPLLKPCYPFLRITRPDGSTLYWDKKELSFLPSPVSYLGRDTEPIITAAPRIAVPLLFVSFNGIAPGTYALEAGAVDAAKTTSPDNLVYYGPVDRVLVTVAE